MGLKPGAARQKASASAMTSAAGRERSSNSMQGWEMYQGVSQKTSTRLPSGSRK